MLALLAAALLAQAPSAPMPTSVELCNETPARAAFAVTRPTGPGLSTQRAWFNVAPGECLSGAIGTGRAGEAQIHARSGSFRWPAEGGAPQCVAAPGMDRPVEAPPCAAGEQETGYLTVPVSEEAGRYRIRHTIRCEDLSGADAALCARGVSGADGFAALVREVEACNTTDASMRVAAAAQLRGEGWRVEGWADVAPQACTVVWRGQPEGDLVFVRAEFAGVREDGTVQDIAFCTPDADGDFQAPATPGAQACAEGETALAYRPVSFGANTERVTIYD